MGWTKGDFITAAYDEIGYANYIYDLSPEMLSAALRKLDSMMSTWDAIGIHVGYPIPSSPSSSDLSEETGVPIAAIEAITLNLAIRLERSVEWVKVGAG